MSAILTISPAERAEPRLRLGAAVLPSSFRYTEGDTDVVGILGDGDWAQRAADAVEQGARGVLVVDPGLGSTESLVRLRAVLSRRSAALVLDRGWASSPSLDFAAEEFDRLAAPSALVESRLDASPDAEASATLLAHLALVRASVSPVRELRMLRVDATGYDALGTLEGGADVNLSAIFSHALTQAATVRIVRPESTVLLELGAVDVAAPGRLSVLGRAGRRVPLLPFETPHRGAWRRLHAAVTDGTTTTDLDAFVDDAELTQEALSVGGFRPGPRVAR